MCTIADGIMFLELFVLGAVDLKRKLLPVPGLVVMSLCAVLFQVCIIKNSYFSVLLGILIGAGWLVVSWATREAVGYGDSWLILILGVYLGGRQLLFVILVSAFGASLFSVFCCMKCGWNRRMTIPFAPFLAAAFLGVVCL